MQTNCSQTTSGYIRKPEYRVAMAYVPWQQNCNMYENLDEAFRVGTIFPVLNKPFKGGEKCR